MNLEKEKNIYQYASIFLFIIFLVIAWKYTKLSDFAKQQSADKVAFCQENRKLWLENEVLKNTNKSFSNVIDSMRERESVKPNIFSEGE